MIIVSRVLYREYHGIPSLTSYNKVLDMHARIVGVRDEVG
jgi:hypothetical protein